MPNRTVVTTFDQNKQRVEALVQAMPRSFKMHVWANYVPIGFDQTIDLVYLGYIQPLDQTDGLELELLVKDLFEKEYEKRIAKGY